MGQATLPTDERMRNLVKRAAAAGWPWEQTRGGHYRILPPGREPIIIPGTPSDPRSANNSEAHLKRAGLPSTNARKPPRHRGGGVVFDPDPVVDKLRLEVPRFAQALKDARTAAGWSQLELAIRLGLKQASISHYERGRMQPGMATLYAIQRLFGWGDFYGTPTTEEATVPEPAVAIERVEPAPLVVVEAVPDDRGDIIGRAMAELTRMHAACMAALTDINGENLRLRETILNLRRENRNLARQRTA